MKKELLTYHRREVTRHSGYHVSGEKTGGECIILPSKKLTLSNDETTLVFYKEKDVCPDLFCREIGMLAFAAYIKSEYNVSVKCKLSYVNNDNIVEDKMVFNKVIDAGYWMPIAFHEIINLNLPIIDVDAGQIADMYVEMNIKGDCGNTVELIGVDMGAVNSDYYISVGEDATKEEKEEVEGFWKYFNQKTAISIPYTYYLDATLPLETYLLEQDNDKSLLNGTPVVLKGCNRCARYLPVNIDKETQLHTASYALHCKKRAPCTHSTFARYKIDNFDELTDDIIKYFKDLGVYQEYEGVPVIVAYYGHQLECKACKKYFVNAKLNPMRDTQQHREDALRRRAIEVLVDTLLDKDFIHFEYRKKNKKEFTEHIWNKFGKRCFKCGRKITINEMHLDHTMPLAYLYRLDETATCLCAEHNSQKSDMFPADYYTPEERTRLSEITGIPMELLNSSKVVNLEVVEKLRENIVWFFDDFLNDKEYQKIRDGKLTADKIYAAIKRVLKDGKLEVNLIDDYFSKTGKYPKTITIK